MLARLLVLLAPIGALASTTLPHKTVYSFPNTTFYDIENVAVRSNGQILLNLLSEPSIYSLDPALPGDIQKDASLLHTFPNATKLDGIVEYQNDVFAIVAGNALSNGTSTYSLWSIDFNTRPDVSFTKLLDVPGAGALNGITTSNGNFSDVLLIADAKLGAIWRVNITSATAEIAYSDSHFLPTSAIAFGINGVHTDPEDSRIYFSTSANNTFGYISPDNGEVSIIAANIPENKDYDDFALAATSLRPEDEWAWAVAHPENLMKINLATGSQEVVLSGLTNPTSAALARCGNGLDVLCCTLYVVTQGSNSSNGTTVSGSVVQVEIC